MKQTLTTIIVALIASLATYFITIKSDPTPTPQEPEKPTKTQTPKKEYLPPLSPQAAQPKPTPTPKPTKPKITQPAPQPQTPAQDDAAKNWQAHGIINEVKQSITSGKAAERLRTQQQKTIEQIAYRYKLNPQQTAAVKKILTDSLEKHIERETQLATTVANSENSINFLNQLLAAPMVRPMTPEYRQQIEDQKKLVLGDLYQPGTDTSDHRLSTGLAQITTPTPWYSDNALMLEIASSLGDEKGAQMIDAAQKVEYHNKYAVAHRRADNTAKNLNLPDDVTAAFTDLYIKNPNPTEQQLSEILTPEQVNRYLGRPNSK